jgi:hypothetical protein
MRDGNNAVRMNAITLIGEIWNDINGYIIYALGGVNVIIDGLTLINNRDLILCALIAMKKIYEMTYLLEFAFVDSKDAITN